MGTLQHLLTDWSLCRRFTPELTMVAMEEAPDTSSVPHLTVCLSSLRQSTQHARYLALPRAEVQLGVGVDAVHTGVVSAGVLVRVETLNTGLVTLLMKWEIF